MNSILEPKGCRICYVCGMELYTEEHHIFYGTGNRKQSEKHGLKVHLCYRCHRAPKSGIHGGNRELDLWLKQTGQQAFEALYGHEVFMQEFGKNYL